MIVTALQVKAVLVFPRETLGQVCALLGKRHPNQESTLQQSDIEKRALDLAQRFAASNAPFKPLAMTFLLAVPHRTQTAEGDCLAACAAMVLEYLHIAVLSVSSQSCT